MSSNISSATINKTTEKINKLSIAKHRNSIINSFSNVQILIAVLLNKHILIYFSTEKVNKRYHLQLIHLNKDPYF